MTRSDLVPLAPRFAVVEDDLTLEELYAVHACFLGDEPDDESPDPFDVEPAAAA